MNIFQVVTSHRTPISINCHYTCSHFRRGKRKKSSTQCVLSQIDYAVGRVINRQWMFVFEATASVITEWHGRCDALAAG